MGQMATRAKKEVEMMRGHMTSLAKLKIEPVMQIKDQLTNSVLQADRMVKRLGMEKASPLLEAQDRISAVVTRVDAALKAVDRGDVKVLAEMQGPLMDEIVRAKASLKALEGVRAGPVAELRGELFGQLTRAFTEAKKLGQLMVEPRATLRERVTWKVREIGTGLRQLTSRAWTVTIEAKDKVAGVAKRIGGVLTSPLGLLGMGGGAVGLGALVKDFVMTAGRTETLNIAMESVAKSTGTSMEELIKQREAVMGLGIAEQEATMVMTRFMQGQLNVAEAAKVARVAQDAAVIAGVNSSEATATMVEAISKLSPELLTSFGMTKNMSDIFADYADTIGVVVKTTDKYGKTVRHMTRDLTEGEKKQAMLNYVLEEGAKIAGTYEGAMGSAFKKMGSLARYWQEFKEKIGAPLFLAAFGSVIDGLTDAFKSGIEWAKRNEATLEQWGKKVAGVFDRAMERVKRIVESPEFQNAKFSEKVQMLVSAALDDVITWLDTEGKDKMVTAFASMGEAAAKAYVAGMKELGSRTVQELKEGNIKGAAVPAAAMYLLGGAAIVRGAWGLGKGVFGAGKRILGRGAVSGVAGIGATETAATTAGGYGFAGQRLREWFVSPAGRRALEPIAKQTIASDTPERVFRYRGFLPGTAGAEALREAGTAARTVGGGWAPLRYIEKFGKVGDFLSRWAVPIALATGAAEVALSRPENRAQTGLNVGGRLAGGFTGATIGAKAGVGIGTLFGPGIGNLIGGAIGALSGGIAGALGGEALVKRISEWVKQIDFGALKATVGNFFTETIPERWNSFWSAVGSFFTETVPYALGYTVKAIEYFFTETLPQGWNSFWNAVGDFFTKSIPTWWSGVCESASNWWTGTMIPGWINFWSAIGDFFIKTIPSWASSVYNATVNFFTVSVPTFFANLWNAVYGFFTGTLPAWAMEFFKKTNEFFTQRVPAFFTNLWDTVATFVTGKIPEYAKELQDSITGWLGNFKEWASNIWEKVKSSFSAGYEAGPGPSRGSSVAEYAYGGILTRPHLGLVAEAGPEAIIPLSAQTRGRALKLWAETGKRLGVEARARKNVVNMAEYRNIKAYAAGGFAGAMQALPVAAGWGQDVPASVASSTVASGVVAVSTGPVNVTLNIDAAGDQDVLGTIRANYKTISNEIAGVIAEGVKNAYHNMPK